MTDPATVPEAADAAETAYFLRMLLWPLILRGFHISPAILEIIKSGFNVRIKVKGWYLAIRSGSVGYKYKNGQLVAGAARP